MARLESLVGGWFSSSVIGRVVDKAQKYLEANWVLQKNTQKMVETLTHKLLICQAAVKEVEKRAIINNPALADLVRILKEAVYDAEDVLDNMEIKSIKEEVQENNKVRKIASSSLSAARNMFFPDDNHKSLEKVVDQLNKLSNDITKILLLVNMNEKNESHTHEVTDPRETISQPLEEVELYGRQDELNLILEIILRSKSESSRKGEQNYHGLFVIPIVGLGGVGKTALAQAVYNNPKVQQTFDSKAWISVSYNLDVVMVMRKIIQSLESRDYILSHNMITLEGLSKKLCSIIGGVKFIIVLDEMFESQWDVLYKILLRGAPGSVVIITTQNQVFANRVGTFGPIPLSALDTGIFWNLFKYFAFRNLVIPEEKRITLESIGRKIAEKLGGLPLAAKIIGNILFRKVDEDRWKRISKSEWWDIPEGQIEILPSIGLGYEQLNPSLRQCFAYCSVFPKNSLIEKDRLVHMWIAHNFIQSDVNDVKRLEDIGRQWFDELVEKSFFQRVWDNDSYVMPNLMYDLAVIVSSGECFYLGKGVDEIPLGVRHLAVDTNNLEVIKGIEKHKKLRSFLYFGCCQVEGMYSAINDMLSNLDSIRVLDLSYMFMQNEIEPPTNIWKGKMKLHSCKRKEREPPTSIWKLPHLRFLDLSSTGINVLTHSSVDLYHLQALYIQKCYFLGSLRDINKLINLRHLIANEQTISGISGIGKLTNLQEIGVFNVGNTEGHKIMELRNLREIRGTLRINYFENIKNKDEAKQANLGDKKHLDSISIYSSTTQRNSNVDMEVLEELQPHKDIKDLRISCYAGSVFPNWIIQIGDFLNLNTLYLLSCVNVQVLPPLGELPSLKHLQIEELVSIQLINYDLYGKKQIVFPFLEELVLTNLSKCREWKDARAREFFARLSKLTIACSPILREVPLHSFSSSLKELIINKCYNLISLEQSIRHLSSLTLLKLCDSSMSISFNPIDMPLLEDLTLEDCSELKIEGDLQSLTHLKRLKLVNSPKLFSRYSTRDHEKGKGLQVHQDEGLRSLTHIEADRCLWGHWSYHQILGSLPSLQVLNFNKSEFGSFMNHQVLWLQKMTALQEIHFSNCEFKHLPTSLTLLFSLKKMKLISCSKLESLTDSIPPNLQELYLKDCERNLVQLCQAYQGEDWQFISSIPVIHINDATNRMNQIRGSREMRSMEIRKPHISEVIGRRACAACGKIFNLRDFVLHNWESR